MMGRELRKVSKRNVIVLCFLSETHAMVAPDVANLPYGAPFAVDVEDLSL